MRNLTLAALSFAGFACAADMSTAILRHSVNTAVTNKDVVTLAKAGFDEEFIMRAILGARCNCDTSAEALAALAEQGISQRVVEVMLDASYRKPAPLAALAHAAPEPGPVKPALVQAAAPAEEPVRERRLNRRPRAEKQIPVRPVYESRSVLWGLWHRQVGVAESAQPEAVRTEVPVNGQSNHILVPSEGRVWHTAPWAVLMVSK